MDRAVIAMGIVGLGILAGGCKSHQSPIFAKSEYVRASSLAGTWTSTDGRTFTIRETPGGGLIISDGGESYTGVLVNIGGSSILEIPMSDPSRMSVDASPVYHYGLVKVSGDTMEHQGLSPAWLASQHQQSSAIVAAPLASGTGTVTATDPETMRGLLKKAVADPNAWGAKEILTRKE
ncbi:MAG: hypothetical protein KF912_11880 [Phycisphaeraceae bacterium]|nr:hypothetical protein [Phycisphaeraceae bacterium]MBX3368001.1 hypothetical protein [Phycisphaeraceae bacterium]